MVNFIPKILAIDHINDNLISLKSIINNAFPRSIVYTSTNGPEGIELAIANNPDVILLDINRSGIDGFEICKRLKQDKQVRDIPVVFITAKSGDKEGRINALEVGAEGFLSKPPIDETELTAQIRAMVKIKAANEQKRDEQERLKKMVEERTFALQNELNEKIKAKALLRESEYFFKESQRAAFVGSYKFDIISDFWTSSEVLEQIFGIDKSYNRSLQGWLDIAHPDDRNMMAKYFSEEVVLKQNPFNKEYRIIRKSDGETRWVLGLGKLNFDAEDNIIEMIGTIQDITERKQAEESLRETNEFNNSLLKTIPFGMDIVDEQGNILFQSENMEKVFGRKAIGCKCWDLYRDDKVQCIGCPLKKGIEIGETETYETTRVMGGRVFEISHTGMMFKGKKALLEIFQDISDRKWGEETMRTTKKLLEQTFEQSPVPMVLVSMPDMVIRVVNPACLSFLGIEDEPSVINTRLADIKPTWQDLDLTGRSDKLVELPLAKSLMGKKTENEERYIIRKDGTIRYELVNSFPIFDDEGRIIAGHLIMIDVTERKQALEELQKSYDLLNKLTAQVPGVVYQYRLYPDGRTAFPFASPGMFEIYEVTPEEVREDASPVFTRIHPDDYNYIVETITESARNQTLYHSEFRVILPKQGLRWRLCDAKPELLEDGSTLWYGIISDITDRKEAEAELREKEVQYRNLANSGMALIWTTGADKLCNYVNDPWLKFTGRTLEQEIGNGWAEGVHPDDLTACVQSYNSAFEKREAFEMEYRLRHASGEYRWLQDMGAPNFSSEGEFIGYIGHCFDITDRKKLETELIQAKEKAESSEQQLKFRNEELIERNRFIQTILDNLPIGVALNKIDEGRATYMNKKFEEIYGWNLDEITSINSFFEQVYPEANYRNKLMSQIMEDIQSGEIDRMHWENIFVTRKDGSKRVINAVNIPLMEQNTMVSTVSDITELHKMQNDLVAAKEKAEESDRLKSAFLANMSHEIRTPLNSIIGFSDLLLDPEIGTTQLTEFAKIINDSGNGLLTIISDIMDISKIEAGQIHLDKKRFPVQQLVSNIQKEHTFKAVEKGIELQLDPSNPKEEIYIESDENRIKQVLHNLVDNALKFTEKGSVGIGFDVVGNCIQFSISDSGIGIPKEYHSKIFERFRQVESPESRRYGGNGLGLAISKSLVEIMGGEIWMESVQSKGSTFYFTIPAN